MEDVILHSNFFFISFVNLFHSLDDWVQSETFYSSLFFAFFIIKKIESEIYIKKMASTEAAAFIRI